MLHMVYLKIHMYRFILRRRIIGAPSARLRPTYSSSHETGRVFSAVDGDGVLMASAFMTRSEALRLCSIYPPSGLD
jgi:hypothetical protein